MLVNGDAAWSIMAATRRDDVLHYLDDCRGKGINAIIANVLEAYFAPDPPRNLLGDEPFLTTGDFGTPNDRYFSYVDWVVGEAGRRGIVLFLVPTYLGYPEPHSYRDVYGYGKPEGWFSEVLANGVEGCRSFGAYLGRRYRGSSNIVWMIGGDRNPDDARDHMRALAIGIQSADDRHLFTAHALPEAAPLSEYQSDPWLAVNSTYSYGIVHAALLREYLRQPARPNVLLESTYEWEHNASDVQIRRQAYWAILCGAAGQFIGTNKIYDFAPGWRDRLDSSGRTGIAILGRVLGSRRWWELVPDLSRPYEYTSAPVAEPPRPFIVSGVGELRGLDFCSAARTADGTLAMAYMPSGRTIGVDLTQMAGDRVSASWFDPETGAAIVAGGLTTDGTHALTPPSGRDWLLVLESA